MSLFLAIIEVKIEINHSYTDRRTLIGQKIFDNAGAEDSFATTRNPMQP